MIRAALLACLVLWAPAGCWAQMAYIYGSVGRLDDKDNYTYALLDEALKRTEITYGAYDLHAVPEAPRNRQVRDLAAGSGSITLAILGTAHGVERSLRPILIPIDKGLVGYRLLLIRRRDQARFDDVRTPADLKAFTFGQNFIWDDVDILKANGLAVQTGEDFEGLFQMLARNRFDSFPRALDEIGRELDEHAARFPDLGIEKHLLLHYPLPVYFWFSRSPKGEALAKRLEEGLQAMIVDGTFDAIFWKYTKPILRGLDIEHRRVLKLANPMLAADTPLGDARLWISPEQLVAPH